MDNQSLVDVELVIVAAEVINERILGLVSRRRSWSCPAPFQLRFETCATCIKRRCNVHWLGNFVRISALNWRREGVVGVDGQGDIVGATCLAGINIDAGQ